MSRAVESQIASLPFASCRFPIVMTLIFLGGKVFSSRTIKTKSDRRTSNRPFATVGHVTVNF